MFWFEQLLAVHPFGMLWQAEHLSAAACGRTPVTPSAFALLRCVLQLDSSTAPQVLLLEHDGVHHAAPDCFLLRHSVHLDPYSLHASAVVYLAAKHAMDFPLRALLVEPVLVLL